jgi:hypothetical protein
MKNGQTDLLASKQRTVTTTAKNKQGSTKLDIGSYRKKSFSSFSRQNNYLL